jgi:HEAT repeat protein
MNLARTTIVCLVLCAGSPARSHAQRTDPDHPAVHGAPAAPVAVTEARAQMRRALLAIEGEAPASFFTSRGAAGRDVLLSMLADASEPLIFRRRAAIALHHFSEPVVFAALLARAIDTSEDAIVSRYALRTLGLTFGPSAFEVIAARLADPRAFVREGAALSLRALDATRAEPYLQARLAIEPEAFVRSALD